MRVLLLSFFLVSNLFARDAAYPKFLEKMSKLGINSESYDHHSKKNLQSYLNSQTQKFSKELIQLESIKKESEENEDRYDLLTESLKFYSQALSYLKEIDGSKVEFDKKRFYITALRIVYAVETQFVEPAPFTIKSLLEIGKRFVTSLPNVREKEVHEVIGEKQAKREAVFLYDAKKKRFLNKEEVSTLTHDQISNLDVSPDHPAWHTESYLQAHKNTWGKMEKWANEQQAKALKKKIFKAHKKAAETEGAEFNEEELSYEEYSMHKARKVLFLSNIKTSATSAKVNTKDAYGQTWKLKWGNEVQAEPVGNRLAMKLGAKFADMVYANKPGKEGVVLVLESKDKKGSCDHLNTYALFKQCLLESTYNFLVEPYVLEKGVLTSSNIDSMLKYLPKSTIKKFSKEELLGREYITFRESSVEFKSDEILSRAGAVAGSFLGAEDDRSYRGNLVFAAWIWNIDQKDLNTKAVIAKDFPVDGENKYLEFTHDFGASFGIPGKSMHVNTLDYGRDFMTVGGITNLIKYSPLLRLVVIPGSKRIYIRQLMLFRPKAWEKTTFADGLWMAKKIVKMSKRDIAEVTTHTLWPDYMQAAFVQKLVLRRNTIAKVFKIEHLLPVDEKEIEDISFGYDLSSPAERAKVANRYKLDLALLEKTLLESKAYKKGKYIDHLVTKNQVVSCEKSVITNLLEKKWHPSGLERRQTRAGDAKALGDCKFNP
jgi:hypothetical protein